MQVSRVAPDRPVPSLMHRRRVMADRITYAGLDVHKESIVVAVASGGLRGEVREYGRIANTTAAVHRLRRARQQLSGFLLRQGCHYGRPAWTKLHRRWLAGLKFDQAIHHNVLEDYIAAVEAAQGRRDRLTAQITAMLPDWTLAPV